MCGLKTLKGVMNASVLIERYKLTYFTNIKSKDFL